MRISAIAPTQKEIVCMRMRPAPLLPAEGMPHVIHCFYGHADRRREEGMRAVADFQSGRMGRIEH
jgi:hypothetical protein